MVVCNSLCTLVRQKIKQDCDRMLGLELVFGHQLALLKRFVPGERYSSDAKAGVRIPAKRGSKAQNSSLSMDLGAVFSC